MRASLIRSLLVAAAASVPVATTTDAATLIVLNKSDDNVSLIEPTTGRVYATIPVGDAPHEAATSPDGKTVVVCNYGPRGAPGHTLSIIDLPTQQVIRTIDLVKYHRPHGVQFFPDGKRIVVTSEEAKKLLIVDIESANVDAAIDTDQDISHMVAMTHDQRLAFVANISSGSASVIDLTTQSLKKVIHTGEQAEGIAAHPTRNEVWVSNRRGDTINIIDTTTLEIIQEMPCGEVPIRVAFTPDGSKALVSCAQSADVAIFDAESRKLIDRVPMEIDPKEVTTEGRLFGKRFGDSPVPIGILIEPTGKLAYVANTNADIITVIDIAAAKVVDRLIAGREPDGLAWSPLTGS